MTYIYIAAGSRERERVPYTTPTYLPSVILSPTSMLSTLLDSPLSSLLSARTNNTLCFIHSLHNQHHLDQQPSSHS